MKYKQGDVVWCRAANKAAVVMEVADKHYEVRSYDGDTFTVTENALGKK